MDNNPNLENNVTLSPRLEEKIEDSSSWWMNLKKNIVDDPTAPELYSQKAIWGFSILLAPIFGAVLMAMNFKQIEKPKFILPIILFGILWYALAIAFVPEKPQTSLVYLFNMFGGSVILYFVWPKFIGKDLKYRKRKILIPTIIGIVVGTLFLLAMIAAK